ncbi:MAG: SUMF1/EgtB/PvdO family nonheme iron enzyme [Bacteroidia bacterium]
MKLSVRILSTLVSLPLLMMSCTQAYQVNKPTKEEKKELREIASTMKKQNRSLTKEARAYFEGMRYIPAGSFVKGYQKGELTADKNDTTLILGITPAEQSVAAFYMSQHEVTNGEYRQFVHWVRDSIALTLLAQKDPSYYADADKKTLDWQRRKELWKGNPVHDEVLASMLRDDVPESKGRMLSYSEMRYSYTESGEAVSIVAYPDTLVWIKDWKKAVNEPMAHSYFGHEAYNDYPVIGVTWQQANAYCRWRSVQFRHAAAKGRDAGALREFRLPTEAEWEYAALAQIGQVPEQKSFKRIFPWDGVDTRDNSGRYRANFGNIVAQNGLTLKWYIEDGGLYPVAAKPQRSTFKTYRPNDYGLYNMAGNVAEWTSDIPSTETQLPEVVQHNSHVLYKNPQPRIVKGGSWADGPAYMLCASREAFSEDRPSSRIGFRVVMGVE